MKKKGHLNLVPYNPNDYSLGEVLTKDHREIISDHSQIDAVLSLYFQWPENSICYLISKELNRPKKISLTYDQEERTPTELWIKVLDENQNNLNSYQTIKIRFEIFRTCYEFEADVVATNSESDSNSPWNYIIQPPNQLLVYKTRRLPRVPVAEANLEKLATMSFVPESGKSIAIVPQEIGLLSIKCRVNAELLNISGIIILGQTEFPVDVVRRETDTYIFIFKKMDPILFGKLFDIYRTIAFPSLRSRSEFHSDEVLNLYLETNYFGKFDVGIDFKKWSDAVKAVWQQVSKVQHSLSADYVVVDKDNSIAGASSATYSFKHDSTPVWVFHQLCAKTNPDLLEQSGQLYTWRAEYLAAFPEKLKVIVWFSSKSRWLERLYVKFSRQKYKDTALFPIQLIKRRFYRKAETLKITKTESVVFGENSRYITDAESFFGGFSPIYLNAGKTLESIVELEEPLDDCKVEQIANDLLHCASKESVELEVTARVRNVEGETFKVTGSLINDVDRICFFPSSGLVDFLSSVEHSVAITVRKHNRYGSYEG